jgi:hypothetical protein
MIDPPGYDLCKPYYIKSKVNLDMNDPGIRYFHLWDLNADSNGNLNRVGKVFPDQQIIIFDDEEIVAALSYKSNRNWTLPAPQVSLITPNLCSTGSTTTGLLNNETEKLWVTYLLQNTAGFTNGMHCNYYSVVNGPQSGTTNNSKNVAVRFGPEFQFLNSSFSSSSLTGFAANTMKLLVQKVTGDTRPVPTGWYEIDVTSSLGGTVSSTSIPSVTFQIDTDSYSAATQYNLSNYISLVPNNSPDIMNFGDEYYFYGNFETDISATIYEMKYLVNLNQNQFTNTTNPTWASGTTSYVTEIGLYDGRKTPLILKADEFWEWK